ncbi:MAG TPA: class A beta-lactamase [Hyphomonadaceae bacterium]|jgi:beta-lactamase class A|nr:class A beta-lactamase [Hyphomonadaceae bacterium]HPN06599.1 class A beta-lactamase [Hyphomonadaceae bacterium]
MQTRRGIIAAGAGLALAGCAGGASPAAQPATGTAKAAARIAAIEARLGGRIGVSAIDTGSNAEINHRAQERFAMASTFKWLLAAGALKRCEEGLNLDAVMYYTPSDLIATSPITAAQISATSGMGSLSVEQLCEAIVTVSDNTAANLLLVPMFGPEGFTRFIRESGDPHTRLDRVEPELNENRAGDPRDTTVPHAMARTLRRILTTDEVLNADSRTRLIGWMEKASTGLDRLRAGFPQGWRAGDKTGTGGNGSHNDCAIVWPPGRSPIVIASYLSESAAPNIDKAAAHAEIARIIVEEFA